MDVESFQEITFYQYIYHYFYYHSSPEFLFLSIALCSAAAKSFSRADCLSDEDVVDTLLLEVIFDRLVAVPVALVLFIVLLLLLLLPPLALPPNL